MCEPPPVLRLRDPILCFEGAMSNAGTLLNIALVELGCDDVDICTVVLAMEFRFRSEEFGR